MPGTDEWQVPFDSQQMVPLAVDAPAPAARSSPVRWPVRVLALEPRARHRRSGRRVVVLAGLAVIILLAADGWAYRMVRSMTVSPAPPTGEANSPAPQLTASARSRRSSWVQGENGITHQRAGRLDPRPWRILCGLHRSGRQQWTQGARQRRGERGHATGVPDQRGKPVEKPNVCPAPYKPGRPAGLPLAGQPGGQLEYTCGTGPTMRHGISQVVIVNKTAFYFYLTVPDSQFAASKVIFER